MPISALKKRGHQQLIGELRNHLPEGTLYQDPDFVTDRPERFFVFRVGARRPPSATHEEVPYAVAVVIDSLKSRAT